MRVAFMGASGVGKTTLTEYVRAEFGLPVNPVGSRAVAAEMGFASPYDADKVGRRAEFQRRLTDGKAAWEAEHEEFVTDRTTLDHLAYQALHDVHSVDAAAYATAVAAFGRYTHVFWLPVSIHCEPGGDPARVQDAAYHRVFESLLVGLFTQEDFAVEPVVESDLEGRKAFVARVLRRGRR